MMGIEATEMRFMGWGLAIFLPPCLAFLAWRVVRFTEVGFPWKGVRLGKHGYWIVLTVIYIAVLATALIEHKIF